MYKNSELKKVSAGNNLNKLYAPKGSEIEVIFFIKNINLEFYLLQFTGIFLKLLLKSLILNNCIV